MTRRDFVALATVAVPCRPSCAQAETLVLDAAPIAPVYFNTHVYYLHPSVKGWQPTPMDHSDYRYVWLEK